MLLLAWAECLQWSESPTYDCFIASRNLLQKRELQWVFTTPWKRKGDRFDCAVFLWIRVGKWVKVWFLSPGVLEMSALRWSSICRQSITRRWVFFLNAATPLLNSKIHFYEALSGDLFKVSFLLYFCLWQHRFGSNFVARFCHTSSERSSLGLCNGTSIKSNQILIFTFVLCVCERGHVGVGSDGSRSHSNVSPSPFSGYTILHAFLGCQNCIYSLTCPYLGLSLSVHCVKAKSWGLCWC